MILAIDWFYSAKDSVIHLMLTAAVVRHLYLLTTSLVDQLQELECWISLFPPQLWFQDAL